MHEAFVYKDPKVDILNVSEDGVHINLTLRGGVDVDRALAVDGSRGKGIWESLRRSVAHGVLGVLPTQAVYVTIPEVWVQARASGLPLLNVTIPGDLVVPLTRNGALVDLAVEAVAHPIAPTSQLWDWSMQTWANGTIDVVVGAQEAHASIPGAWWSKWAVFTQTDVVVPLEMPGKWLPLPLTLSFRHSLSDKVPTSFLL
jgi:hypothetical protein